MPSVTLTGLELVTSVDAFVPNGAEPGTFVCTGIIKPGEFDFETSQLTLTMQSEGGVLTFSNLRLKREPNRDRNMVRLILEDERQYFRSLNVPESLSVWTADGDFVTGVSRDLDQIWQEIETATGFTIDTFNLNSTLQFIPSVRHKTLMGYVKELLHFSACRMIPDPTNNKWIVRHVDNLTPLNLSEGVYKPIVGEIPATLTVRTGPTVYHADLDVEAVLLKDDMTLDTFGGLGINPRSYFNGFAGNAGGQSLLNLQRTAFRLWRVTGANASDIQLLPVRLETIAPGSPPVAMKPHLHGALCNFDTLPWTGGNTRSPASILNNGGNVAASDHPVLPHSGGSLGTALKLRTAYNLRNGSELVREEVTRAIGGTGGVRYVDVPQIAPIVITHANTNIDDTAWSTQLSEVADLHAARLKVIPQQTHLHIIADVSRASHVSAVRYRMHLFPGTQIQMHVFSSPEISGPFSVA